MGRDLRGKTLGPFRIQDRLGQGAMGTVYKAVHTKTGKKAAIKVMSTPEDEPNPVLAARFEREIKLLSQFHHPHIVRIFGSSEADGIRYYAMELIEGPTLADLLEEKGRLSPGRTIAYAVQICEALQELHSVGVIHRDLKPANLLVTADHRVKLTDFGIAKDTSTRHTRELTRADHTVGTVAYMSPEQLTGEELTRKSDLYSLGIVLYRLLTGQLPFSGETMFEYMNQRARGTFPAPSTIVPSLPREFDALISDLLAQDPKDRPMDAYVVMQRLLEINQKEKEGGVQKTRPETRHALAETVAMPRNRLTTLVRTMTGVFTGGAGKRKAKSKRGSRWEEPFWESPWVLGGVLLAILGGATYALWPKGPDALLREADALLASDDYNHWQAAIDQYLAPVLERYPEYAKAHSVLEKKSSAEANILTAKARGQANQALRLNIRRKDASEAEKKYIDALLLQERFGDRATAQARFRAIVELFENDPASIGWVRLARQQLEQSVRFESDADRLADKRKTVAAAIDKSRSLRTEGKTTEALQTFASLEALYGGDPEVADLIRKAIVEFFGPEDLFAKGQALMQSSDPADWQQAFSFYFDPLLERFPGDAHAGEIAGFRDRLDRALAEKTAAAALEHGLGADPSPAEEAYVLAIYLERKLGDQTNAVDLYAKASADPPPSGQDRGFALLAKDRLAELPTMDDPAQRRSARRQAALQALQRLKSLSESTDAVGQRWAERVRAYYARQADLADLTAR